MGSVLESQDQSSKDLKECDKCGRLTSEYCYYYYGTELETGYVDEKIICGECSLATI